MADLLKLWPCCCAGLGLVALILIISALTLAGRWDEEYGSLEGQERD